MACRKMRKIYCKRSKMNMDETTVRVLKYKNQKENEKRRKSYIRLGIGGPKDKKAVIYRYYESRNAKYIKPFINGFKGWLQTDGYPGYESAINNPDASIGEQCSMFRTVCSHKVIALGFNTLCYDAERRGIKPSARIK